MDREKLLKNIPPILGLIVMTLTAIALRRSFILAVPVGIAAWWLARFLLAKVLNDDQEK
ncbi:MAG: hypothetical protein ACPGO7_04575 [Alphaproteobacteria bacterium]